MRRLWTDIVAKAQMPILRMQRRGIRIDVEARDFAVEEAARERKAREAAILGHVAGSIGGAMPPLPGFERCGNHPDFIGASPRRACAGCAEIYGTMREWRNSKAVKKAKRLQDFNVASDDHLRWLLFEALALKPIEFTETGKPRVNIRTLEELVTRRTTPEDVVPLLHGLVGIAHLDTLINVFLSPPVDVDGRVRPPLTLEATSIGRVRSGFSRFDEDKPSDELAFNIQNIPERVRHIYVADPGKVFIELDASKIEWILLMLLAGARRADVLYREGADVHTENAKAIAEQMGVEWGRLSKEEKGERRRAAKRLTHGFDYGMMPNKTARMFRLDIKEARSVYEAYFRAWPEIRKWQEEVVEEALRTRMLRNPFGRIRRFWDVTTRTIGGKRELVLNEPNEAYAFKPASTNADLWKVNLRSLEDSGFEQLTGTHDSHLIQVDEDKAEAAAGQAIVVCEQEIEELAEFNGGEAWRPIFEAKIGRNWGPQTETNREGLVKWS